MIEKHTFCDLMYQTRDYWDGVLKMEESLNIYFDDNFLTKMFDKMMTSLARSFFDSEQLSKVFADTPDPSGDCDQVLVYNYETVEDLLYHYTCNSNFGREWGLMDDTYIIRDKEGKVINSFDGDTPEELYDIIIKFISRDDDNHHTINCSTVGRGKSKNENNLS